MPNLKNVSEYLEDEKEISGKKKNSNNEYIFDSYLK